MPSFEMMIALRYLRAKKRRMVSLITLVSICGVALGVASIITVLSVMNGFQNDLRERILGTNTHVVIFRRNFEGIADFDSLATHIETVHEQVIGASPFIYSKAMITHENVSDGIVVWGVDPDRIESVSELRSYVENLDPEKSIPFFAGEEPGTIPGVILGRELAIRLGVKVGDKVTMSSPFNAAKTPFGLVPRLSSYPVTGTFNAGLFEYNSTYCFMPVSASQSFFRTGDTVTGIQLKVENIYEAPAVADEVVALLGGFPYWANDWISLNGNLFSILKLEKMMWYVVLALIVLVASFNIVGTLVLLIIEKTRSIGILRSMGAGASSVTMIFLINGLLIGLAGTIIGCAGGFTLSTILDRYEIIHIPADVYMLTSLPVQMQWGDFVIVSIIALLITMAASIYPSLRASKITPVEAVRYD